jgi:hypothetical protein
MLTPECVQELRTAWLPNLTDTGLDRLIDLLEKGSPLLIHGCFSRALPMGCLATHAAWNHPRTEHLTVDAGIRWLHHVAGLNPATSHVIREWDRRGAQDWEMRSDLLGLFRDERSNRQQSVPAAEPCQILVLN